MKFAAHLHQSGYAIFGPLGTPIRKIVVGFKHRFLDNDLRNSH
jgi:hypothetical protein